MRVTVEPEAVDFIRSKGGHLILFQAEVTGCCGVGSAMAPNLDIGLPRRPPAEYRSFESDGITVHVDNALDLEDDDFRVSLTSIFGWRSLSLSREGGFQP